MCRELAKKLSVYWLPKLQRPVPTPGNETLTVRSELDSFSYPALAAGFENMQLEELFQIPYVRLSNPGNRCEKTTVPGDIDFNNHFARQRKIRLHFATCNIAEYDGFIKTSGHQ